MELDFDADFVEADGESLGTLVRRKSKVDQGRNLKENGANDIVKPEVDREFFTSGGRNIDINEAINLQDAAGNQRCKRGTKMSMNFAASDEEFSSTLVLNTSEVNTGGNLEENIANGRKIMSDNNEVGFNKVQNREVKSGCKSSDAGQSQEIPVEHTVRHESKEYLNGGSTAFSLSMDPSNKSAVLTEMPVTHLKAKLESSVYYAEDKGLWKCRHCSWVYPVTNPGIALIEKHKEHCEGMNNENTSFEHIFPIKHTIQKGSQISANLGRGSETVDYESKQTEFVTSEMVSQTMAQKQNDQKWPSAEGIWQSHYTDSETLTGKFNQIENINNGKSAFLDLQNYSNIGSTATVRNGGPMNKEGQEKIENSGVKEHQHWNGVSKTVLQKSQDGFVGAKDGKQLRENQIRILEDNEVEDIVKILKEQQSHDLVCPNCGSCITERVILRKRKRTSVVSEGNADVQAAVSEDEHEITEDQRNESEMPIEHGEETEAYGCLTCFSLFCIRGVKFLFGKDSLAEQYPSGDFQDSRMLKDKEKDSFRCFPFLYPWGHSTPGAKAGDAIETSQRESGKQAESIPNTMPSESHLGMADTLHQKSATSIETGSLLKNDGEKTTTVNQVGLDEDHTIAENAKLDHRLKVSDKDDGAKAGDAIETSQRESGKQAESISNTMPSESSLGMADTLHQKSATSIETGSLLKNDGEKTTTVNEVGLDEDHTIAENAKLDHRLKVSDKDDGAKAGDAIETSQRESGKQAESIPNTMPSESNLGMADTLHQKSATSIETGSLLKNNGEKTTIVNEVGLDEDHTIAENAKLDHRLNVSDKDDADVKEFTEKLPYQTEKQQNVSIQNIRSHTSTTTKSTHTYSIGNVEFKQTNSTTSETTKSAPYLYGSSESLQAEEQEQDQRLSNLEMTLDQFTIPPSGSSSTPNDKNGQAEATFEVSNESVYEKMSDMHFQHKYKLAESKHLEQQHVYHKDLKGTEGQPTVASNGMSDMAGNKELSSSEHQPDDSERDMVVGKGKIDKKDHLFSCIPVSIPTFWSWSSKELIADEQLKEPLLRGLKDRQTVEKEALELRDDQQREVILPTKLDSVESSRNLETHDPATTAEKKVGDSILLNKVDDSVSQSSEITPDSRNPSDSGAATVINIAQPDDSQPANTDTSVSDWDLLKSIVYGGLTVSVTSLGVVSSAAGGEAKTLTVIAISLANLIAGFFLIITNILYLAHFHQNEFTETVGHSFWFNGFIAILSYLICGSLAPITYGFSFRKSDDTMYKFLAASLVSLGSIILLAFGKARVTTKSYIKTVVLYVVTGFWASFIGFFAGKYIKKLLEKWGFTTD